MGLLLKGRGWRCFLPLILVLISAACPQPASAQAGAGDFTPEDVQFQSGGVTLDGTVLVPEGEGRRAAMVLIHGAGPHTRSDELYRDVAELFASAGLVTLFYDKRTAGYSATGVGEGSRSFALLADDALAAVALLRSREDVDPARIGLWGLSQGGWVAPLAASRSADVAFVITVGANGIPPIQQTAWSLGELFRHQGVTANAMLQSITLNGLRFLVDAEMFAEATYDPVPVLERLEQPILAIWGSHDRSSPPAEGAQVFQESLRRGGNQHYTVQFIADASHDLLVSPDGFTTTDAFAPGYREAMIAWVNRVTAGDAPGPDVIGAAPDQPRMSPAGVVTPTWRDSALLHLAILAVLALLVIGYAALGLRPDSRHRASKPGRWPARLLAAIIPLTAAAFFTYLLVALMNYTAGPVVAGQPVAWLALRLLAWAAVALTAWLAFFRWTRAGALDRGERLRIDLLLVAGLLFVPWALHWRLLV